MLSQLFSLLSRPKYQEQSVQASSRALESSASLPVRSQESFGNKNSMTKMQDQLTRHEGEVLHAYQDHLGYLTIGIGRLIDKRKGGGISREESAFLFSNDVNNRLQELQTKLPWFSSLDDPRKAVLLNMSFQLGVAGLMGFSKTLSMISSGKYSEAADQMLLSKWAQQTPGRANELSEQMRTGQWQSG